MLCIELDAEPELLALTHFPEQTGLCNVPTPGVPACTEPVHNVLFWNMVQVLQQVCNELNARGMAQRPLTTSAVLDSLQCPHATPQHARSSPVMECLVEVLDANATAGKAQHRIERALFFYAFCQTKSRLNKRHAICWRRRWETCETVQPNKTQRLTVPCVRILSKTLVSVWPVISCSGKNVDSSTASSGRSPLVDWPSTPIRVFKHIDITFHKLFSNKLNLLHHGAVRPVARNSGAAQTKAH